MSVCLFFWDLDAEACKPWAVMRDREAGGAPALIAAITLIIDKYGTLRRACYGVNPNYHAVDILNRFREID